MLSAILTLRGTSKRKGLRQYQKMCSTQALDVQSVRLIEGTNYKLR
jgi:hypothetical protein